jgi:alpha-amylase
MKNLIYLSCVLLLLNCNTNTTYKTKTMLENNILKTERVDWLSNTNVYEINVRQYTKEGTFAAFQKHIPRLKEMGVKVLWFMPIHPIGILNRKETLGSYYSIKDYKGINPEFGELQDFKNIIAEAHNNGMKVIIDWVANHTSWDNDWVKTHPEYYAKDSVNGKMYAPYDWADVVQLDHNNKAQQNAMIDAMEYWVTKANIDGFRCDMAHLTPLDFWKKARLICDTHKQLFWLAESQDKPYFEAFDVIYGWEWLHKMEDYYNGKTNIAGLDSVIIDYNKDFNHNKFRILFTSNHDENSWQDTEYKRLGKSAKAFATICATLPGIPLLYSGQEEPLMKKLNFFNKDNIEFKDYTLSPFYTSLLQLKIKNGALAADANSNFYRLNTSNNDKVLVYLRKNANDEVLVVANMSNENKFNFTINDNRLKGTFKNIQSKIEKDFTKPFQQAVEAWNVEVWEK